MIILITDECDDYRFVIYFFLVSIRQKSDILKKPKVMPSNVLFCLSNTKQAKQSLANKKNVILWE